MTSIALVVNSASGSADEEMHEQLRAILGESGSVEVVAPKSLESFDEEVTAAASHAEWVVVAGGDGSLNCAINALQNLLDDVVFGLIPMGTGNDLARTLGLSDDPESAARALSGAPVKSIDVGRASSPGVERLFVNACMGGFPVAVDEAMDGKTKERLGPIAFWVGGARALNDLSRSRVIVNGADVQDCIAVGVGNGRSCGGGMEVWPAAAVDDGRLDACAFGAPTVAAAVKMAGKVKTGSHADDEGVLTLRAAKVVVEADPQVEFNVDGELVGLATPASFEIVTQARFLVPGLPDTR